MSCHLLPSYLLARFTEHLGATTFLPQYTPKTEPGRVSAAAAAAVDPDTALPVPPPRCEPALSITVYAEVYGGCALFSAPRLEVSHQKIP